MTVALWLMIRWRASGSREGIVVGLLAGVAVLSRATFVPLFLAGALLRWSRGGPRRLSYIGALALAAALLIVPWMIRNHVVLGTPVITTTTGYALWIGNNAHATGSTVTLDGRPIIESSPEVQERLWGKGELEQDRIFRELVLAYVIDDPWRAARSFVAKLSMFWWFGPTMGVGYPLAWKTLYAIYYIPLLLATVAGTLWMLRARAEHGPLIAILLGSIAIAAVQSVFYVDGRHRWAIEPVMLVLASASLGWVRPDRIGIADPSARRGRLSSERFARVRHEERPKAVLERRDPDQLLVQEVVRR